MHLPAVIRSETLPMEAGVSRLTRLTCERIPHPVLLKEPAQFWDEEFIANEAQLLDGLTHPRIRRKLAYDAGSHRLFLEFIEADTLQSLVQAGLARRQPARLHRILQSVAETMADLHGGIFCRHPIIHNDLKSMNVLVPHSAPDESVLIDFSHAYFKGRLPGFIAGQQHNPAGTAKYMAPEKWDRDFREGMKSDVFAFGVLAYYACTEKYPFDGGPAQIERQIREAVPPSPAELGARVYRNVSAMIMLCLEKSPGRRPVMEHVARCYAETAASFR